MKEPFIYTVETVVPMYFGKLLVVITNSREKLLDVVPMYEDEDVFAQTAHWASKPSEHFIIMLNPNHADVRLTHGTIAHEALHVANFIAGTRGFEHGYSNDEPLAYIVGWVTNQVYDALEFSGFEADVKGIKPKK